MAITGITGVSEIRNNYENMKFDKSRGVARKPREAV